MSVTDDRVKALARINFRIFWGLAVELSSLSAETQALHFGYAREQLRWMEEQGWLK